VSLPDNLRRPPLLCYVTGRSDLPPRPGRDSISCLLEKITEISAAGVDWIQIREKDLSGRDCAALVRAAVERSASASASAPRIIVNDRLDIALSEAAAGVHLGEKSLSLPAVKKLLEERSLSGDFPTGVSCHSLESARSAEQQGADYVFFGPVFATPAKISYGPAQGLAMLEKVSRALAIPVLAIGGISAGNAGACISAGASGIAAIRLFQDAPDPAALVTALRRAFL
jgi:thiamine-phosphate pyrophosphorylase